MLKIPVTIGEAIDRLIILQLKLRAAPENKQLAEEANLVGNAVDEFRRAHPNNRHFLASIMVVEQELAEVNAKLWSEEDMIRDEVKRVGMTLFASTCASRIIELNDKRSELKRQLNRYYNQPQTEVKIYSESRTPCNETETSSS